MLGEMKVFKYEIHKRFKLRDEELIFKALDFAVEKHKDQKRETGEPYIIHPIAVATILLQYGLDAKAISAALLHDVVEDSGVTPDELKVMFGEEVAELVNGVSRVKTLRYKSSANENDESLRKMFLAMAKDIRVIFIKLADRLHNMRTLDSVPKEHQIRKSLDTRDIYIPIAERLGLSSIKGELEDLVFKYLYPEDYNRISLLLEKTFAKHQKDLDTISDELKEVLRDLKIKGEVKSRFKRKYSIFKKQQSKGIEQIYDILALRILVNDIKDCYVLLGEVHNRWKPVPGRIKDYIAAPKPNGYQSLHTTLLTDSGLPFEVQIRTYEMHKVCEYGIAAHWMYKAKTNKVTELDKKLTFLRQMIEENAETLDTTTFLSIAKSDFYANDIFVFTPKNKVIQLTERSTPIDFAYALHTDIGNTCIGAKVNGKMVPLTYRLSTGDVVEIITSPNSKGPSRDWLKIAQTSSARNKIRTFFKKETKEDNIKIGKEMLELEAKRKGTTFSALTSNASVNQKVMQIHNFLSLDDVAAAVGYGGVTATHIVNQLISEIKAIERKMYKDTNGLRRVKASSNCGVVVKGVDGLPIRLAGCCNPIPPDNILGFVSIGKGIVVHRADCPNIRALHSNGDRLVKVVWKDYEKNLYSSIIQIKAVDSPNLLNRVTSELSCIKNVSLTAVNAKATNHLATITITVTIKDTSQITDIVNKLSQIDGVKNVFRK